MTLRLKLLLILLLFMQSAYSQIFKISGTVLDGMDKTPLVGVNVVIVPQADSSNKKGTAADAGGHFVIEDVATGTYRLEISYVGFMKEERLFTVTNDTDLKTIDMKPVAGKLQTVIVTEKQVRAEQLGDTSQFNADAFKTNPDATAEDLVKKMPGITADNGGIKVNGEDVKQVMVDGKPFFGDDPSTSLKNLPAEIIDKVQVFDNLSDQSQFTGFNDGNSQKTINLITKKGKNIGQFGKIYAGYGTDNRYNAGGSVNIFNGDRRLSIIGMSNNINQQNFSIADIMSVMNNSGDRQGAMPSGPPPGMGGNRVRSDNSGGGSGSSGPGTLLTGQQNGNTTTHSLGINYTDLWSKKLKVSGSYFLNASDNLNESTIDRTYFTGDNLKYNQQSVTQTKNTNNRLNLRLEYEIDSKNSILITPRLTLQENKYSTDLTGKYTMPGDSLLSITENRQQSYNSGYSFANNVLYRHKFNKKGRTISLNIGTQLNGRDGSGSYYSLSQYSDNSNNALIDQQYDQNSNTTTFSGNLSYTEPVGKTGQLMISYNPSYTTNNTDKQTSNKDSDGNYSLMDTSLSNKYQNTYNAHRGGLSYRIATGKMNLMLGADVQQAILNGTQTYPQSLSIERSFTNVLPSAQFNYRISNSKNLRVMYRTATNAPSIAQLQDVVDVSNSLQLKTGNADLKQNYESNLMINYGNTNRTTSRSFFVFLMGNYTKDYIGNATLIPTQDSAYKGYTIHRGSQLTLPVNLDGYYNARAFGVYSMPIGVIKSNLNLNGGLTYAHAPGLINQLLNYSNTFAANGGLYLGSNISPNLDFGISYNGTYNIVKNTVQKASDNNYFSGSAGIKLNWIFLKGFVLNTDVTHNMYSGLSESYNQNFLLWNASFGYKFLKNQSLEAKVSVFDILKQNRSISRSVTEAYTEDTQTQVLQRYVMFTLTYTLRHFKSGTAPTNNISLPPGMPPPGNMPPPGG